MESSLVVVGFLTCSINLETNSGGCRFPKIGRELRCIAGDARHPGLEYPHRMAEDLPTRPGPLVGGPSPKAARSSRPMSRSRRFAHRIGAPITLALLQGLWRTYRFHVNGQSALAALALEQRPMVVTFWHGELLVGGWFLRRIDTMGISLTYLISPSKDGDFAMRILERIGGKAVRGSATRSGVKALKGLYRAMTREGGSPVLLPDGPRGPNRKCKRGAILLSQMTQAPIVPIAIESRPSWRLKSWDRLLVPPPFARVAIEVGTPYIVPTNNDEAALEHQRQHLEDLLLELGTKAASSLNRSKT